MIRHITFCAMAEQVAYYPNPDKPARFGDPLAYFNPWLIVKKALEEGNDTFIWVVTRKQMPEFMGFLKKYDLEKFCVVKMTDYQPMRKDDYGDFVPSKIPDKEGITNFNYPGDHRKLKLFVMKGAKA